MLKSWRQIFALNVVLVAIFCGLIVGFNDFSTLLSFNADQSSAGAFALGDGQAPSSRGSRLVGRASVIDGDTIEIHGRRIRLFGSDAPESEQVCHDGNGREYRCGQRAKTALSDKIGWATVDCEQRDIDQYERIVAVCRLGVEDLNAWMVAEGWALAYRQYSTDYVRQERAAKAAHNGIWQGSFVPPWDWQGGK